MDGAQVAAALLSALLHAGWNAAIKASPRPTEAIAAQMMMSALLVVPGLCWTGLPPRAAWPWLAASTLMNLVAVSALLRAYALGGFGLVYPLVRAVSVLLVVPLAAALVGERLGPGALMGVAAMALALALLGAAGRRDRAVPNRAFLWTGLAGLATAAYVMCDAAGVRHAEGPWAYGFAVSIANGITMSWRQRRVAPPWRLLAGNLGVALPTAVAAIASYLLILWVWSGAPVAPAAALRDTSAVFAILIAVLWLKEPITGARLAAVLLAALAVPLLRLA